jgi:hypothetical protein
MSTHTTVIGLFGDPRAAASAVEVLFQAGFRRDQVSASARDPKAVAPPLPDWLTVYPEPGLSEGETRLMVATDVSRHEAAADALRRHGARDVGAAP